MKEIEPSRSGGAEAGRLLVLSARPGIPGSPDPGTRTRVALE